MGKKVKIYNPSTGETKIVDDSELAAYGAQTMPQGGFNGQPASLSPQNAILTPIDQPQTQPQQQGGGFLQSLIAPLVKGARTIGEGANEGIQSLSYLMGNKNAFSQNAVPEAFRLNPQEIQQIRQHPVQEGIKQAAGIGAYAIPFGRGAGIVSKALLPGAAVGGLNALSEDNATPESVATNALAGAASAGVLHGGIKALGATTRGVGGLLNKTSDELTTKGLRPSPSQQVNFFKDTGEKLNEFMQKRGLQGADYNKINQTIEPLQNAFNEVANSTDLSLTKSDITSEFNKIIKDYASSTLPEQKAKAKYLKQVLDNLSPTIKKGAVADAITTLRREADVLTKDYATDGAAKGKFQLLRDIYQGAIRKAADRAGIEINGMSAKDAGVELSKLYKLQDIAERQQFLGKGSQLLNLPSLLGAGAGGAVGGIPGAVAGVAATKAVNSPPVLRALSKGASAVGGALVDRQSGNINTLGGQVASRLPGALGKLLQASPENNQEYNNESQNNLQSEQSIPQQTTSATGYTLQELGQGYTKALQAGDSAAATQIKKLYDLEASYQKQTSPASKTITASLKQRQDLSRSGLRAQKDALEEFTKDPNIVLKGTVTAGFLSRKYDSAISRAVEGLLRARSGAAVPKEEVRKYIKDYGPRIGDSIDVALYKLEQLRLDLNDALQNNEGVVPDNFLQGGVGQTDFTNQTYSAE